MKFQDKLKKSTRGDIWSEYCGFLDLSLDEYMFIQKRLMREQLQLWSNSGLGKSLLPGKVPETIDEFREIMPLTSYEDYAETLLGRRSDMLPVPPAVWAQAPWEGGLRPIKLLPYTRAMLDSCRHNILSVLILSSCNKKGDIRVKKGDKILYGGAALPHFTGLLPSLLSEDICFSWLPDAIDTTQVSFSKRLKQGLETAFQNNINFFITLGNAAAFLTPVLDRKYTFKPIIALRYLKAKYILSRERDSIKPADIFKLKGMICTGSDIVNHKEMLEKGWGAKPIEIAFGPEAACIAVENWERNGMCFFPDSCFYEFIPESEMTKSLTEQNYTPRTCLMDEVKYGESYELVISVFHGGAFMRYRVGDMYRCLCDGKGGRLPRFTYIDRVPSVIDISGFSQLTQSSIEEIFRISGLGVGQWLAKKEYDDSGKPFVHIYLEILPESQELDVVRTATLSEHFLVYLKYFDSEYNDLRQLLDYDPIKITVLKYGLIDHYISSTERAIPKMNPSELDIAELLRFRVKSGAGIREGVTVR